jgi:hypothetical protein
VDGADFRSASSVSDPHRSFHWTMPARLLFEEAIKLVGQPALESATLKKLVTAIRYRSLMQNSELTGHEFGLGQIFDYPAA